MQTTKNEREPSTQIRLWEERDIERLAELEILCFSEPWSKAMLEEEWQNPLAKYLVYELEGSVQAYAGAWVIVDEVHITNVAVHPECRRHGMAHDLLLGMMAMISREPVVGMTLEVREGNDDALALYQKNGFSIAGKRPNYYGNGASALIMWNHDISSTLTTQREYMVARERLMTFLQSISYILK